MVSGTFLSLLCAAAVGQSAFPVKFDVIRKSDVFIYKRGADGQTTPAGTGFLIAIPLKSNPKGSYTVLVTARHLVDPAWLGCSTIMPDLVLRFNKKYFDPTTEESGTVDYEFPGDSQKGLKWMEPKDDSADIAWRILDASKLKALGADYDALAISSFPRPEEISRIDTGSPILSAGLMTGASGRIRNYPIFKFGYVSSRPDEKVNATACPNGKQHAFTNWMIAASLVPGSSGSPIFFAPLVSGAKPSGETPRAVLIGVQSSSFPGWDIAGMSPIQFLIDSLKDAHMPDFDLSTLESGTPASR
jgi:hypothetical protein